MLALGASPPTGDRRARSAPRTSARALTFGRARHFERPPCASSRVPAQVRSSRAAAARRSAQVVAVVTFKFVGRRGSIRTVAAAPARPASRRRSPRRPLRVGVVRARAAPRRGRPAASAPPRARSRGLGRRRSAASRVATRLIVSVIGAAAITPAASGSARRRSTSASISSAVTSGRAASWTATSSALGAASSADARPTRARVAPPVTTAASTAVAAPAIVDLGLARPAAPRSRRSPIAVRRARSASSDQASSGRPATSTSAFGPPAPSLSPEPAAAISAAAWRWRLRRWPWRRSAPPAARRCTPRRRPRPCRGRT